MTWLIIDLSCLQLVCHLDCIYIPILFGMAGRRLTRKRIGFWSKICMLKTVSMVSCLELILAS